MNPPDLSMAPDGSTERAAKGEASPRRELGRGAGAQTLDRGLRVLEQLADSPGGLTVGEIASRIGIHRAIAYRLVGTLEASGYVRRVDGRYRLWVALLELSRSVLPEFSSVATPILASLADDLGATAHLAVLDGDEVVVAAVAEPRLSRMHIVRVPGLRNSAHLGASGPAILSARPPSSDDSPKVQLARRQGYSESHGELNPGAFGLAAPLIAPRYAGEASVGVVALAPFPSSAPPRVIAAAKALAELLGA